MYQYTITELSNGDFESGESDWTKQGDIDFKAIENPEWGTEGHRPYRGKGYATDCLNYAKELAKENQCYKMMLLTGSKEDKILEFYRSAGYNSSDKTAFIQWLDYE